LATEGGPTSDLTITDDAGVRWIALDRPESKNGLTDSVNALIIDALDAGAAMRHIRCIVITGKGGNFCSGLDLKALAAGGMGGLDNAEEHLRKYFHGMIRAVRRVDKPVIALVDGAAVGYGCDLALACDVRIGTERTRFGEVFVKRGLMPDGGGTWSLPRLVGVGKALELMFTGDLVGAEESQRLGLLNRIVPSAEAEQQTWELAKRIAEALDVEARGQVQLLHSKDFLEGIAAFFQKRPPNFTGE